MIKIKHKKLALKGNLPDILLELSLIISAVKKIAVDNLGEDKANEALQYIFEMDNADILIKKGEAHEK